MAPAGGAEAVFKTLFAQEYSKLCRYALTYMQDTHQAEDVVQDTFIRVWETRRELIASPEVRFYLITAVRNNCISALRKRKSAPVQLAETTPEPEPEPFITATQRHQEASEQSRRIAAALDRLPPKCREVFLLVKQQGMSYKQAAAALDISVKTVENQMGKAIRVLRESPLLQLLLIIGLFLSGNFFPLVGVVACGIVLKH